MTKISVILFSGKIIHYEADAVRCFHGDPWLHIMKITKEGEREQLWEIATLSNIAVERVEYEPPIKS